MQRRMKVGWMLLCVMASAAVPAAPGEVRWGTRPYEQEQPRYESLVETLEEQVHDLEQRQARLQEERRRYWSEWSRKEREAAREWFESSSYFEPEVKGELDAARRAYEHAWRRWSTQRILTLSIDVKAETPVARAARRFLWRYNLERLRARVRYLDAALAYARLELRAVRQYAPPAS